MTGPTREERWRGCLLGLACGDAVGTTVEFQPRGSFPPVTDMVGGGPFRLAAGQWTDDTSMALCLADSLLACDGFDAADQMARYRRWQREGERSCTGHCFDIGRTVSAALQRYSREGEPFAGSTDPNTAGNGALMRLAPVVLRYAQDEATCWHHAGESTRTTHAAPEALDASRVFALMLRAAVLGAASKDDVLAAARGHAGLQPKIAAIAEGAWRGKAREAIRGSGYAVASLEAALWCFATTDRFEAAVLAAANLGDDADTTAAICGQIAGAWYGAGGIPPLWLARLAWREEIERVADALLAAAA